MMFRHCNRIMTSAIKPESHQRTLLCVALFFLILTFLLVPAGALVGDDEADYGDGPVKPTRNRADEPLAES
jgi:hypothetical protein